MKPRSRGADGRFIRELPDGTIDAVALGTIATGLVLGAADHVPSANARPVDHHAAPNTVPPLTESAAVHGDAPPADNPSPANAPAVEAASHADGLSTAAAVAQTLSPEGDPSVAAPMPSAEMSHADPPPLHETLGAIADTISSAMQTLVDHVQANATHPDDLSSMMQHVGAIADSAVAMVNDIAATALPALPDLPALPAVTETVHQVLDAALPELPAIPAVPQVLDQVLGAALPPDLPGIHTDLPASVLGAADAVVDHVATPIVEAQPLQIGFLGQSYTEVHDPHDPGSHGLTSMLHGMV